jgi:proton-coupled amino acid transporter
MNLFKGFVGIGILSLPISFSFSGYILGLILIIACSYIMYYTSALIIEIVDNDPHKRSPRNYTEFCVYYVHSSTEWVINFFLFSMQLAVCIGYCVFFTKYFQESFCFYESESKACKGKAISHILSLCLVLPISFFREMKNLKPISMIANIILLFCIAVMLIFAFE